MGHSAKATAGIGNAGVEVELEFMRKSDCSWHPCKITLSSSGDGLVIEDMENGSSETIVEKEEALERIRTRSIPLKDDNCTLIQLGDHVLAKKRVGRDSLLLDATVDKLSKKAHPRCTFVVKWIHGKIKGETTTVLCNAMWKVSRKSINFHPTIIAFFNTLGSSDSFSIPPNPTVTEEIESKIDTKALGKLMENISIWKGNGLTRMPELTESNISPKMEFSEVKPIRNPLAARAALASMIAKTTWDREMSPVQQVREEFKPPKAINGCTPDSIFVASNFTKAHDHSLHTKSGTTTKELFPKSTKSGTITKELFPKGKTAEETQEVENEARKYSNGRESRARKDNPMPSNGAKRLTRSAYRKAEDKVDAEIKTHTESSELDGAETKTVARQKKVTPAAKKEYKTSSNVVQENVSSGRVICNMEENSKAVSAIGLKKDDATSSNLIRQGTKRKSLTTLKKQETRSSLRLRLLAQNT